MQWPQSVLTHRWFLSSVDVFLKWWLIILMYLCWDCRRCGHGCSVKNVMIGPIHCWLFRLAALQESWAVSECRICSKWEILQYIHLDKSWRFHLTVIFRSSKITKMGLLLINAAQVSKWKIWKCILRKDLWHNYRNTIVSIPKHCTPVAEDFKNLTAIGFQHIRVVLSLHLPPLASVPNQISTGHILNICFDLVPWHCGLCCWGLYWGECP